MFRDRIPPNRIWILSLVSLWIITSTGGTLWLAAYGSKPGESKVAPDAWPRASRLTADLSRANLVLFAHPHCPCSRASIDELAEIMAKCPESVTAHVLFLTPQQMPATWEVSDLWHRAAAIPRVRVFPDQDGEEAQRFGARTSGHVLLFDRSGVLKFSGGITVARGHRGESLGHRAIVDWLTQGTAEWSSDAVFGCPLFSEVVVSGVQKR